MSITQISVFVESRPGHLVRVLSVLGDNDINIHGFSAGDTGEYGIVRFVVDKPVQAAEVLQAAGFACRVSDVLCAKLDDKPGELRHVLSVFGECGINIVYCYSLSSTFIAFAVKDLDAAAKALAQSDITLVSQEEMVRSLAGEAM